MAASVIITPELQAVVSEIERLLPAKSTLFYYVLARCVVLGRAQDSTGLKALELLARLALGDQSADGSGYTNQDDVFDLSRLSLDELAKMRAEIESVRDFVLGSSGQGVNGNSASE